MQKCRMRCKASKRPEGMLDGGKKCYAYRIVKQGSGSCRKGHVRLGGTEGQWLFDGCDRKDCEENEQIERSGIARPFID